MIILWASVCVILALIIGMVIALNSEEKSTMNMVAVLCIVDVLLIGVLIGNCIFGKG